jgi:hypothetical protein
VCQILFPFLPKNEIKKKRKKVAMFLHICSKAISLVYERISIKESKEKKTLRFTKFKKRKPYSCCAIYFLIWGTVVLVIANKGTISVARKQEVAEIRE